MFHASLSLCFFRILKADHNPLAVSWHHLSFFPSLPHVVIIAIKGRGREIVGQQGGQLIANRRFQVDYDGCGDLSHLQKTSIPI